MRQSRKPMPMPGTLTAADVAQAATLLFQCGACTRPVLVHPAERANPVLRRIAGIMRGR